MIVSHIWVYLIGILLVYYAYCLTCFCVLTCILITFVVDKNYNSNEIHYHFMVMKICGAVIICLLIFMQLLFFNRKLQFVLILQYVV
jgi:hypothetical protein